MRRWRLVESPLSNIFDQMQLDRELFEAFIQDQETPPLLRIFQVNQPGMTVGRLHPAAKSVCVRPTGGGVVCHGNDLIYSVMARRDSFPTFHQVRTSYLSFHEAVQAAFFKLNHETEFFRCDDPGAEKNSRALPRLEDCFQKPVPTDVKWKGKKIAGGAQWRRREGFLHQGSVQLIPEIDFGRLKTALIQAFEEKFEIEFEKNQLIH